MPKRACLLVYDAVEHWMYILFMLETELKEYIRQLCNLDRQGGRLVKIDDDTVMLMDISQWTDDMAMCMKHRFPLISICVQQSRPSLSGFCIIFSNSMHANHSRNSSRLCIALAVVLVTVAIVFFTYAVSIFKTDKKPLSIEL